MNTWMCGGTRCRHANAWWQFLYHTSIYILLRLLFIHSVSFIYLHPFILHMIYRYSMCIQANKITSYRWMYSEKYSNPDFNPVVIIIKLKLQDLVSQLQTKNSKYHQLLKYITVCGTRSLFAFVEVSICLRGVWISNTQYVSSQSTIEYSVTK